MNDLWTTEFQSDLTWFKRAPPFTSIPQLGLWKFNMEIPVNVTGKPPGCR
jgi:hypothetical protein